MKYLFVYKYELTNDIGGSGSGRYGLIAHFSNDQVSILPLNVNVRVSVPADNLQKIGRFLEETRLRKRGLRHSSLGPKPPGIGIDAKLHAE